MCKDYCNTCGEEIPTYTPHECSNLVKTQKAKIKNLELENEKLKEENVELIKRLNFLRVENRSTCV